MENPEEIRSELEDIKEKIRSIKIMILSLEHRIEKIEKQLAREESQRKIQQYKKLVAPPISELAEKLLREKPIPKKPTPKKTVMVPETKHKKLVVPKQQKPLPKKPPEHIEHKEEIAKPSSIPERSSLEMFLGGSLFLRFGLLFLIIASITFSYWLYIEVILKLSIIQKILLAYSIGTIALGIGIKILMVKSKWFGESLAGAGMASLVGVSIISYHLGVLSKNIFGGVLLGLLIICISLAKKFKSLALLLEAILGSVMVGFFIAWMYPSRPYAQLYMMMLFVIMFNKADKELRTKIWFISSAYSLLFLVSLLQSFSMQIPSTLGLDLQVISLFGPSIIYLFYSTQEIDRRLNTLGFQALTMAMYILFSVSWWITYMFITITLIIDSIILHRTTASLEPSKITMESIIWGLFFIVFAAYSFAIHGVGALLMFASTLIMIGKMHWTHRFASDKMGKEIAESISFIPMVFIYIMNTLAILFMAIEKYELLLLPVLYLSVFLIVYPDIIYTGRGMETFILGSLGALSYVLAVAMNIINPLLGLPSIYILGAMEHLFLITKSRSGNGEGPKLYGLIIFLGSTIIILRAYLSVLVYLLPLYFVLSSITLNQLSIRKGLKIEEAMLIRIVYLCILQGIFNVLVRDLIYLNGVMMAAIYLVAVITTRNITLPYFLCIYLSSITYYITRGLNPSLLYLFYIIALAISGSIIQRRRDIRWREIHYYVIVPAIVLALISIGIYRPYLVTLATLSFSFSHQLIPTRNKNVIHNSISIYIAISVYKMFSEPIIINILGTSIDYFVLLFLIVYTFFVALSIALGSIGTINSNMLIFPFLTMLLFAKMTINDIFYLVEGIVILTSLALYKLKNLREKRYLDTLLEVLFLLTYALVTAILCYNNTYIAYILYMATTIPLYLTNTFFNETSILHVLASHAIIIAIILTSTIDIYLVIAMGYLNATILTVLGKKLRGSKEITLNIFPIELALLSYISAIETIDTILIPITIITLLIIAQKIYPNTACVTITMLSYTIIVVIETASIFTTYTLIMLAPLILYAYRTNPNIVLLNAPSMLYAITHMGMSPYFFLLLPTTIYIIDALKDLYRSPKKTTFMVMESLIQYLVIAICIAIVALIEETTILHWPLIYLAALSIASWIIDKKHRIEKYSHYTTYGVMTLIPTVFYMYGLRIETTIILAIMGFLSIYGGIASQRKNIRITGITTLITALTKATYDIIIQITTMQISIMLKITASLLTLGLLLIAASYLYLKLLKTETEEEE